MTPAKGKAVVDNARGLVGAHYLWGTRGEIPGVKEQFPIFKNRAGTDLIEDARRLDPLAHLDASSAVAVFAAVSRASGKLCVCAGRFRAVSGRQTSPYAADLGVYLATLRLTSVPFWKPYLNLYSPRVPFGPGTTPQICWGEVCQQRRHFDCIGFVNWCVWKATGIAFTFDIAQWTGGATGGRVFDLRNPKTRPASLLDGDVIAKANHHIGVVSAAGAIIEAREPEQGVCISAANAFRPGSPGEWSHLIRLPY